MDNIVGLVRALISEFKMTGGPSTSPADICGHVAGQLNISEAEAADLIQRAALMDVGSKQGGVQA